MAKMQAKPRFIFALLLCTAVAVCLFVKLNSTAGQQAAKVDSASSRLPIDTPETNLPDGLPRLPSVIHFKNCPAFNELRDVDFTDPRLQNLLCEDWPAYTLVKGHFPLCRLKRNLPNQMYEVVKATAELATMYRAANNGLMEIYTFDRQDLLSRQLIEEHHWEIHDIRRTIFVLKKFPANEVTFLDIGSNIGAYAVQVSEQGYDVVAVDANIRTLIRLQLTAKRLGILGDNLRLFWSFISDEVALRHLSWETTDNVCNVGGAFAGGYVDQDSVISKNHIVDTIPVMTARADDLRRYIKTKKIVMKIDIESGEHLFFKTGADLFKDFDILVLQMEFWRTPDSPPQSSPHYKFITDFMLARNYALYSTKDLQPQNVETFRDWDGIWIRSDFVNEVLAVQI